MEKIATDIYSFKKLREGGFTYVDKTGIILPLIDYSIGSQFFCARPRRFGKSLLISTLQCLFEGKREYFKGLCIDRSAWDWKKYPVIRLDMGSCQADTVEGFWRKIGGLLLGEAERNGVALRDQLPYSEQFKFLISDLAAKSLEKQVVLLVDEYDKPLLGRLGTPEVTVFKNALKEFYSVVKTQEAYQRFAFMTGVSKFSKVSIFSDLNNLIDITMDARFATLFGYTREELNENFSENIRVLAEAQGQTADEAFAKLEAMYDGFRFEEKSERVFNPVSVGKCLSQRKFGSYWFETGTPTFLIEALKKTPLDFSYIGIDQASLDVYEPENPRIVTLLYQTGYLTIKSFQQLGLMRTYDLGMPNLEVENSFLTQLAPVYAGLDETTSVNYQITAARALIAGDVEKFIKVLKNFFANIPYNLTDRQNEQMWQTIVYVLLKAVGFGVSAEVVTNDGRIDMTCETPTGIYLIEFKLDRPAEEALGQIDEKDYAGKYDFAGKKIVKIGISFSSEMRTIGDYKIG